MPKGNIQFKEMQIKPATSSYQSLGAEYGRPVYPIKYSPSLTRTRKDYYNSREEAPGGSRVSLASEELAIQLGIERAGKDPREAAVFRDLFGKNKDSWYAWQWTDTGLRIPKGHKPDKHETDPQGRKYFPRIVLIGDAEEGEVLVPEGSGRVVVDWDETFGIPRVTSNREGDMKPDNHTTHFWFDPSPRKDDRTGRYDVAVARRGRWRHDVHERCLRVGADCGRWAADDFDGVRHVQGSLPEIERSLQESTQKILSKRFWKE